MKDGDLDGGDLAYESSLVIWHLGWINWIELNWIVLNWIELNWNCIELNWIEIESGDLLIWIHGGEL